MTDATPRIMVVGSLNMDMVTIANRMPSQGETVMATSFAMGCGGKGANQATAAARLSRTAAPLRGQAAPFAHVQMVGAVGDDAFGQGLRDSLTESGCDVSKVEVVRYITTGTASIIVEQKSGENRILVTAAANKHLAQPSTSDFETDLVLAQLECPAKTVFAYLEMAHARRARVILNPSPAMEIPPEVMRCVDYLVVNESEARLLSGVTLQGPYDNPLQLYSAADALLAKGATCVVITLGGNGVFYKCSRLPVHIASGRFRPKPVKVKDSTGAGDTFVGAFAVRMASALHPAKLHEQNAKAFVDALHEAINFGMDAAALAIQKRGAQDSIPTLDNLPQWKIAAQTWLKSV